MQEAAIMVTGGSGCLGQAVVRQLALCGRTIVSVYHHKLPESFERVYPVCVDLSSAELMAAPLRGVETVVHLAWAGGLAGPSQPFAHGGHSRQPETANLRMLRHLLTAMERAGTKRLIFLSAAGASRTAAAPFLREKYAAEAMLLNAKIPEKCILRSALIWGGNGVNDRLVQSMLRLLRFPVYPLPSSDMALAPVHLADIAEVVVNACFQAQASEAAVQEVHGGQCYAMGQLFKMVSERYIGRPRLALGGILGESLLPLLERDRRGATATTKMQHLLAIGVTKAGVQVSPSIGGAAGNRLASFQERLAERPAER